MAFPADSDFQLYNGSLITQTQFDYNFQRIPIFWSSGNYDINVNSITAASYVGLPTSAFTATAGESIDAGDVVRWYSGQIYKATNASSAGVTGIAGIASTTTASGETVTVKIDYYDSLSGLTAGTKYYVGVNGAIVSTEPSDYPVQIGFASSTSRLNIDIQEDKTPTGTIMSYTIGTKPNGTLLADGSTISRTAHARLFDVIGTTYGAGDGSTTFGLPNYEGEFLRGLDSSRTIGDTQADATAVNGLATQSDGSHRHQMYQTDEGNNAEFAKPTDTTSVTWKSTNTYGYAMSQSPYPSSAPRDRDWETSL